MPSILKQLANYGVEAADNLPNLAPMWTHHQSDEHVVGDIDTLDMMSNEIDVDIAEIAGIADTISEQSAGICKAQAASGSIENLVDQTIETYGADGITEEGAELMRLSVESILRVSGLGIPTSVVVPSFESGMSRTDYSTEAEEKKAGVLSRILTWVANAFNSLIEIVASFWNRLFNSSASIDKYGNSVLEKIKKAKGETDGGNLALGSSLAMYCSDSSGVIKPPAAMVHTNVQLFTKFVSAWHGAFSELINIKPLGSSPAAFMDFAKTASVALDITLHNDLSHLKDIKVIENFKLKFIPGTDKLPFSGAKVEVEKSQIKTKGEAKVLNHAEMLSGCTLALKALDVMKTIENDINSWTKNAKRVVDSIKRYNAMLKIAETQGMKIPQDLRDFTFTVIGGCRVMADGWAKSTPQYLLMVKANIRYCDLSANKMKADKEPEKGADGEVEVKPDLVKPERYNKAEHDDSKGQTFDMEK